MPSLSQVATDGEAPAGVLLLRVDRDLRNAVPAEDLSTAERAIRAPVVRLPAGAWRPDHVKGVDGETIALVVEGLLTSEIALAGSPSALLRGPGDLLLPWEPLPETLPTTREFTVWSGGATIALLGPAFRRAEQRWPQLAICMQQRFAEQARAAVLRAAIVGLPRVEQRIVALFWHLAERWGVVHSEGVRVELRLTHALIGRLAAARRPTVSLALAGLAEQGILRCEDGCVWWLAHGSAERLQTVRPDSVRAA